MQLPELLKSIRLDRWLIHRLISKGLVPREATQEILEQTSIHPDRKTVFYYLERFLVGTGVLFVLSGIIFFFAYNWFELSRFLKLGMVQFASLVLTIVLLLRKEWTFIDKLLLISLSVLVGVQFAVFGQIYQTGANAFSFFWFWFLSISLWVWVSRSPLLWFLYQCLGNAVLFTYLIQYSVGEYRPEISIIPALVNLASLVAWEYVYLTHGWSHKYRWLIRLVALSGTYFLWVSFISNILDDLGANNQIGSVLFLMAIPLGIWVYTQKIRDLMIVTLLYLALISASVAYVFRVLTADSWMNAFFFSGILSIVGTMLAGYHIRELYNKWKDLN